MNFDEAIRAHAEWKMKLSNYLRHPDSSIDPVKLGLDNVCALGQWLHGEGKKYASLPEYERLVKEHAGFHKAASDIVKSKNAGKDINDSIALGAQSPFSQYSLTVVTLLMALKSKVIA
ncbi:MAG: CZB domain-containing protein [Alphaproteobacteria bacterium]|nr:CZB domain-containing protein [Alphaproteobacteria bacterium]